MTQPKLDPVLSDTPVAPPDMLLTIWVAVNPISRTGRPVGLEQRSSFWKALHAATCEPAYQYGEEDSKGQVREGMRADLAVLSADLRATPPQHLREIEVLVTIEDGEGVLRGLHRVLDSNYAVRAVEIMVGLALVSFSVHQFRAASHPPAPHGRLERCSTPKRLATAPLILAGVGFSATALAGPGFTIAVGMASQEQRLPLQVALLVLWNLLYQAPLCAVLGTALFGKHELLVTRVVEVFGPHRRALQTALAVLLALAGLAVLGDGLLAVLGEHVPWLRQLLLLR
ncbi:MAG: amidohydrolase family protein [Nocardioides sp.]|nr:amidohydrolase family protein [Nocardioides sp.]